MTRRRGTMPAEARREQARETPAQRARQAAIGEEIRAIARHGHPERFAPDGSPLMGWPGRTWEQRLAAWHIVNDPEPEIPDASASDSDQPYARVRERGPA